MTPLKIHGAESNLAVWKENIPILSFVHAYQRSNDWLPWFYNLRIYASTPAAHRSRAN